ncbi:MAG: UDP-N-acetylglucosamine--LPS N-acetylglucosamine transferase [Spirochaetaceae bacterium]|nr:UDP-N-acetylglucosamine--LPS N-acetylglucosamine transferase [Spirochaetaceae bacterium]
MKCSFIYVDAGKGHYTPAKALCDSFISKGNVGTLDNMILILGSPVYNKMIKIWWRFFLHYPKLERFSSEFQDNDFSYWLIKEIVKNDLKATRSFEKWYLKEKPDLIVCTNYLAAPILTTIIKKTKINIPLFVYSADVFDCPNIGVSNDIDIHYLPSQLGIDNCIRRGFYPEILHRSPFPIKAGISQYIDLTKEEARIQLGLNLEKPTIILNFGGEGIGNLEFPKALVKRHLDWQVVVLGKLSRKTRRKFKTFSNENPFFDLFTPGFVDNVGAYIKACDVQLGKTGANSLLESIYLKRPFLMSQLLYTSKAFIDFMKDYKIGWAENKVSKQIEILQHYFDSEEEQKEIEKVLNNIPLSFSSDKFVDLIIEDYKDYDTPEKLKNKRVHLAIEHKNLWAKLKNKMRN